MITSYDVMHRYVTIGNFDTKSVNVLVEHFRMLIFCKEICKLTIMAMIMYYVICQHESRCFIRFQTLKIRAETEYDA